MWVCCVKRSQGIDAEKKKHSQLNGDVLGESWLGELAFCPTKMITNYCNSSGTWDNGIHDGPTLKTETNRECSV